MPDEPSSMPMAADGRGTGGAPPWVTRLVLPLLFLVSGAASLVLETVWTRQLVLVFGSTTFAVSTVLTAFMAGLALGAWIAGRKLVGRFGPRRAILLYGILELAIALYALVLPLIWPELPRIHRALWGIGATSYQGFALLRFLLCLTLLALPTVAMGATLPVLAKALSGVSPAGVGRLVGTLYAINTGGAVLGVFLAGFVLLPGLGLSTTNLAACLADVVLAALAVLLWWSLRGRTAVSRTGEDETPDPAPAPVPLPGARLALYSMILSGAISMAYEVAWSRALSLIIGSSTYAFSLILLCFLLGLGGGAALYARRQTDKPDQLGNLATIHLAAAGFALLGTAFIDRLPAVLLVALKTVSLSASGAFVLKFTLAAVVIFVPALFMGMVFPAVVQIWSSMGRGPARTAGEVYAINTAGSILGSFAAGFVLVPWIGLQQTLTLLVLAGCALAAVFGLRAEGRWRRGMRIAAALLLALAAVFWVGRWDVQLLSSGVFRISRYEEVVAQLGAKAKDVPVAERALARRVEAAQRRIPLSESVDTFVEPTEGFRLVTHLEGVTTTVGIGRTVDHALSAEGCWVRTALLVNGKPDASLSVLHPRPANGCRAFLEGPLGPGVRFSPSGDAETQLLSALLPVVLGPAKARSGLVIGWGSGVSVGAARAAGLGRVVAVELEEEVINAARAFEPFNGVPQRDRNVSLVTEDGRNYLASRDERFDIIISEPSNPWMAGCGSLFTQEFFRQVRAHLAPSGVFLQWLQAYEIAPRNVWSILRTLSSVFPSVHVFSPVGAPTDLLLVARPSKGRLSWPELQRRFAHQPTREALAQVGIFGAADLLVRLRAGPRGVRAVSAGAPLNTDDNARIEFAAPRDLIEYRRYSPQTILDSLQRTLKLKTEVPRWPAGAQESLCEAELRAGLVAAARRRGAAHPTLVRCRRLADVLTGKEIEASTERWLLAAGAPEELVGQLRELSGEPLTRARALAQRYRGQASPWVDAALAHLLYRKGKRRFSALALIGGVRRSPAPLGIALGRLRAALLAQSRAPLAAWRAAHSVLRKELSTGKSPSSRGSETTSRPTSAPISPGMPGEAR